MYCQGIKELKTRKLKVVVSARNPEKENVIREYDFISVSNSKIRR
jgi:hypothetical protein